MSKTSIILVVILVALVGAYWYFFTGSPIEVPLTVTAPVDPADQQYIDLANKINAISFQTGILKDPRFVALTSLETAIIPESLGRIDPFAPLGR